MGKKSQVHIEPSFGGHSMYRFCEEGERDFFEGIIGKAQKGNEWKGGVAF